MDLIFPAPMLSELTSDLRGETLETAAIVLASPVHIQEDDYWRLLVREVHVAPNDAYETRTEVQTQLRGQFQLKLENRARRKGWAVVYCHSHPKQEHLPQFSSLDDRTEKELVAYLNRRIPGVAHASLLIGATRINSRRLGTDKLIRVIEVGKDLDFAFDPSPAANIEKSHDRQILAFGADGQQTLNNLRVAIVGLGGTGSVVAQQLAHLGIDDYLLIDYDKIEETNLNRLAGATPSDVGKPKIDVARRAILRVRPMAQIVALEQDIIDTGVGRQLVGVDLVFCCTDSHASRHLINTIAHQYYLPCIDMGVVLNPNVEAGTVAIAGRVNMLSPSLPCLTCLGELNPDQIRKELLNAEHRAADPYFSSGVGIQQPAVMSLTSTVASLAVTMFLGAVTDVPANSRFQYYDGNLGRVRATTMKPNPNCITCSAEQGVTGFGDEAPLPERR